MESTESTVMQTPSLKAQRYFTAAQLCLRFLAAAATLAAAWTILTSAQSAVVLGVKLEARYNYSSAFKFFAYANVIACALSVVTWFLAFVLRRKVLHPNNYFYMFLHDLVVMTLLMAGCAAATAIGYVGRYGNSHAGWMAMCDHFSKFCNKVALSVMLCYLSFIFYLCLAIISANRSRHV